MSVRGIIKNNKVNRRFAGRRLKTFMAVKDDETERNYVGYRIDR